jgi:hypothetical protein
MAMTSVTGLGEFSPILRLFTLVSFVKITKIGQTVELLSSQIQGYINFNKKYLGLYFWSIFRILATTLKYDG